MAKNRIPKNRSKGALALAHAGHSTDQIVREIGVSDSLVNYWMSGERIPTRANRFKLQKAYAIPIAAWDEPVVEDEELFTNPDVLAGIRAEADDGPVLTPGVRRYNIYPIVEATTDAKAVTDLAGQYCEQVRVFMRKIETDKVMTSSEKAKHIQAASVALDKAGRLTGASLFLPVSKILRTPAWPAIGKKIADAVMGDEDKKVAARIMRRIADALKGAE